ncbi:MAG: hypothetical protein PHT07_21625 [Paludibacter sp.]|nr:hypothetical protein [Paludibacter sp.]
MTTLIIIWSISFVIEAINLYFSWKRFRKIFDQPECAMLVEMGKSLLENTLEGIKLKREWIKFKRMMLNPYSYSIATLFLFIISPFLLLGSIFSKIKSIFRKDSKPGKEISENDAVDSPESIVFEEPSDSLTIDSPESIVFEEPSDSLTIDSPESIAFEEPSDSLTIKSNESKSQSQNINRPRTMGRRDLIERDGIHLKGLKKDKYREFGFYWVRSGPDPELWYIAAWDFFEWSIVGSAIKLPSKFFSEIDERKIEHADFVKYMESNGKDKNQ